DQMTQNLGQGKRSFACKQVNWVGGYSVDWRGGDDAANASVEPNVMVGIVVIVDAGIDLSGTTPIYSSFGLTPLEGYAAAMEMPANESGKLLAPYSDEPILARGYTSMCTEVTLKIRNTMEANADFAQTILEGYQELQ